MSRAECHDSVTWNGVDLACSPDSNDVIQAHSPGPPPTYEQSMRNPNIDSHYAARLAAINALNEHNVPQSVTSLSGSQHSCSRYPASQNLWLKYNVWARTLIGTRPYRQFIPRHGQAGRYATNFVTPTSIIADNTRVEVSLSHPPASSQTTRGLR